MPLAAWRKIFIRKANGMSGINSLCNTSYLSVPCMVSTQDCCDIGQADHDEIM
jgi:hypothetical protein